MGQPAPPLKEKARLRREGSGPHPNRRTKAAAQHSRSSAESESYRPRWKGDGVEAGRAHRLRGFRNILCLDLEAESMVCPLGEKSHSCTHPHFFCMSGCLHIRCSFKN